MEDVIAAVAVYLEYLAGTQRLEADFIRSAASYAIATGVTRRAFLEFGVSPGVLDRAGIVEGRGRPDYSSSHLWLVGD